MEGENQEGVIFPTLRENADGSSATEVESLCMNCHKDGVTKILLTKIPFFKEVVIMAFECDHCGYRSSDVQPGGQIGQLGVDILCKVSTESDLQRSVLLSDSAVVKIPEVELEIPSSKRGRLTTVEGIINEVMDNLSETNEELRKADPEGATKVAAFLARLAMLKSCTEEFDIEIRDPSGNSALEGLEPGKQDPKIRRKEFKRSAVENALLGLQHPPDDVEDQPRDAEEPHEGTAEGEKENRTAETEKDKGTAEDDEVGEDEIMILREMCPSCGAPGESRMKMQMIPFFKEVILMAFACDKCGYRSNEVKPGGQIADMGRKTVLHVTNKEDLSRDILKSDTAIIDIPEIELVLEAGTLGSVFTTIEGMILKVKDNIKQANPFALGDSAATDSKSKFRNFFQSLDKLLTGDERFTVILDDPAGNSFIQNLYAPDPDPEMEIQEYDRDEEQDEELGITDLKLSQA
ncbi:hypothetical protein NDN08_007421 [Rhodosorus marinus]|uniref:Zinc finger ZPR1-type domain-containing protein n=1 Tax=Rhodosorus marinus TaxID=101924 RepID=A0AAV8V143_9RHOD|nr:hypothetical protein NDN08_007421 [Rhodosorus marinus]